MGLQRTLFHLTSITHILGSLSISNTTERHRERDTESGQGGSREIPRISLPLSFPSAILEVLLICLSTGYTRPTGAIPKRLSSTFPLTKRPLGSACCLCFLCFRTHNGHASLDVVQLPVCTPCPMNKAVSVLHRKPGSRCPWLGVLYTHVHSQLCLFGLDLSTAAGFLFPHQQAQRSKEGTGMWKDQNPRLARP